MEPIKAGQETGCRISPLDQGQQTLHNGCGLRHSSQTTSNKPALAGSPVGKSRSNNVRASNLNAKSKQGRWEHQPRLGFCCPGGKRGPSLKIGTSSVSNQSCRSPEGHETPSEGPSDPTEPLRVEASFRAVRVACRMERGDGVLTKPHMLVPASTR